MFSVSSLIPVTIAWSQLAYGTGLIEHCCTVAGLSNAKRPKKADTENKSDIGDPDAYRFAVSEKIAIAFREVLIKITEKRVVKEDGTVDNPAIIIGAPNPGQTSKYAYY